MFGLKKKILAREVKSPNYEVGIRFTFDSTDFERAVKVVEVAFEIETSERWEEVKESKDMKVLHHYLSEEEGLDVKKFNLVNLNGGSGNV